MSLLGFRAAIFRAAWYPYVDKCCVLEGWAWLRIEYANSQHQYYIQLPGLSFHQIVGLALLEGCEHHGKSIRVPAFHEDHRIAPS
jgi:predicted oxidoreductase